MYLGPTHTYMPDSFLSLQLTLFFLPTYIILPTLTFLAIFLAIADEQVNELLKRVKELTGMPVLTTSNPCLLLLSSNLFCFLCF
jgi:hypothetical protein